MGKFEAQIERYGKVVANTTDVKQDRDNRRHGIKTSQKTFSNSEARDNHMMNPFGGKRW